MIRKIFKIFNLYITPYQRTKKQIIKKLNISDIEDVELWVEKKIEEKEFQALHAHRILFALWKNSYLEKAVIHGERAQKIEFSAALESVLRNRKRLIQKRNYSIDKLKEYYYAHSVEKTNRWLKNAVKIRPEAKLQLYKTFFMLAKTDHPKIAVKYGEKAVFLGADKKFKKVVETRKRWLAKNKAFSKINSSDISIKEIRCILDEMIQSSLEQAIEYIETFKTYDQNIALLLKIHLLRKINKTDSQTTVKIGYEIRDQLTDTSLLKVIAARAYAINEYDKALWFYNRYLMKTKDFSIIDRMVICLYHTREIPCGDKEYLEISEKSVNQYFDFLSEKKKAHIKNKLLFEMYFNEGDYKTAIKYGLKVVYAERGEQYPIKLARAYFELGDIRGAMTKSKLNTLNPKHNNLMDVYASYLYLKEHGFTMSEKHEVYAPKSDKVLYVLNNSLPYHSNGYSTRAHGLLEGIKPLRDIDAITRLGYPHDLAKFRKENMVEKHTVGTIDYFHLPSSGNWLNYIPLESYLKAYAEALTEHIKKDDIKIIHSASNFVNGLAANYAAKKLNIKSIYEVRGLWEITRISRQPQWNESEHFQMIKRLETQAANTADVVITITHALKEELIKRGVNGKKIHVLPNGVNTKIFMPLKKDFKLMEKLGIKKDEIVIGYIGSIVEYEGIELLVEAVSRLKEKNIKGFKFLLVGDGRQFERIKVMINELDLHDLIIVTGRIPHEEVENYYSLVDIAPLPRIAVPVSEMVSPLKPFEAMAMGKIVLGSNVAAIAEIIEDGYNGMLFEKSNVDDLTYKLEILLKDKILREKIGKNSREWVVKERDWRVLAEKLNKIYDRL